MIYSAFFHQTVKMAHTTGNVNMSLRKIGDWYYSYHRNEFGRIITIASHTKDRDAAEKFDRDIYDQIQIRRQKKQYMKFADPDLLEKFKKQDEERKRQKLLEGDVPHKRGTIRLDAMFDIAKDRHKLGKAHMYAWRYFVKHSGFTYADEVTPKRALDYLNNFFGKGNGKTFNSNKSFLNIIFRCCLIETGLESSPFANIVNRSVTNVKSHRNMTDEEFRILFNDAHDYTKIMMMLSRWTAQRLETCARITPAMIDRKRKVFVIDPGKTKRYNEWVCCPIFETLETFLIPYLDKCKDKNKPIVANFSYPGNSNFSWNFTQLIRKHEIKETSAGTICFHSIRGSSITWMKEHGIKGEDLRAITGHRSDAIEDIYARDIETISRIAKTTNCM